MALERSRQLFSLVCACEYGISFDRFYQLCAQRCAL